jgi:hypothetical protein
MYVGPPLKLVVQLSPVIMKGVYTLVLVKTKVFL